MEQNTQMKKKKNRLLIILMIVFLIVLAMFIAVLVMILTGYVKVEPIEPSCQPGDWKSGKLYNEMIDGVDKDRFISATKDLPVVEYTPVSLLATQIVSGANYAYLAAGTIESDEPQTDYYIVVIYTDLEQNSKVTSIKKIDPAEVYTKEVSDENKIGGWEVYETGKLFMLPGEKSEESFENAVSSEEGLLFNPITMLSSQVAMTGTSYRAICFGKTNDEKAETNIYIVQWFVSEIDKKEELWKISYFDLEAYIDN